LNPALASPGERNVCCTQQLALIAAVREDRGPELLAALRGNGENVGFSLLDAVSLAERAIEIDDNSRLAQHLAEYRGGYMGFKIPFDRFIVMLADSFKEFQSNPTDHVDISMVGTAQTASYHSSKMMGGFDDCDM
jgi:hypothetical protein